jgi:hypothetical protein
MNEMWAGTEVRPLGAAPGDRNAADVPYASVDPEFFGISGVALLRGRLFTVDDVRSGNRVAVVSSSFPRKVLGDRDLIGARLMVGRDSVPVEVIGIVGDANFGRPRQKPTAMMYAPITRERYRYPTVALSVRAPAHVDQVRDAMAKLIGGRYASLSARKVSTMKEYLDDALARERLVAFLGAIFGGIALLLATMGLYGLLSHQTTRRTREIGVRMALGASQGHALWLVVKQGVLLTIAGLAVGIPLALIAARIIRAQLFGIGASDPRVLAGSAAALAVVGLLAALVPGRRATRIDPMTALRVD